MPHLLAGRVLSDALIPRVATISASTAQTLAERFEVIRQSHAIDIFHVLIAQLPRDSQAQGTSERHRKFVSVHAVIVSALTWEPHTLRVRYPLGAGANGSERRLPSARHSGNSLTDPKCFPKEDFGPGAIPTPLTREELAELTCSRFLFPQKETSLRLRKKRPR